MARPTSRLLDRGYKKALFVLSAGLFVLLASLLGMAIGVFAFRAYDRLPHGSWQQLPQPPATLTGFVASTPMGVFGGEIYASTADGTLYAYGLEGTSGEWSKRDALPPPPSEESYWSGACPEGLYKPEGSIRKPRTPGSVVDGHETRYCGPDYTNDVFFVLLDDGSVWVWNRFWAGRGQFYGTVIWGFIGLILGLLVGCAVAVIVIIRVAQRGSRSIPQPSE